MEVDVMNSFTFPGYEKTDGNFASNYEFESGRLMVGDVALTIHLMRSASPAGLPWLTKSIAVGDTTLWLYNKVTMSGYGQLANTDRGPVVAFVGVGRNGKVFMVTPLSDILGQPTSVEEKIDVKRQAGEFLNRQIEESEIERKLVKRWQEQRRATESAAREQQRQEREEARRQRRAIITARATVFGFTMDGKKRSGVPVVGDEWQCLYNDTRVIVVDAIDGDQVGNLVESFTVSKTPGGNPKKLQVVAVTSTLPATAIKANGQPMVKIDEVFIETSKGTFSVLIYPSMNDIRAARKTGLNGGTYVAVKPAVPGKIEVFSVHHDRVDTIGLCETINL